MNAPTERDHPLGNAYWIIPGRLAAGEYPGAFGREEAVEKVRALLRAGINHFIDLTEADEWLQPYAGIAEREADRLGIEVVHERHPIVDMKVPRSARQTRGTLDAIDAALAEGKTVYVHCWGGAGRTGTVVGCWLVRQGRTGDEAIEQVADWWREVPKSYRLRRSPQTDQQCTYVRNWSETALERPPG